jgi:protoporphyrinogen oxidase
VILILDHADPFPDNWIYIHSPEVRVGRIQNFRSWSPDMVPNDNHSSIGMEYFCNQGDDLWVKTTPELIELASAELNKLGLASLSSVVDGTVIRQPLAYPIYDGDYREALDVLRGWLAKFENLQMVGRNGMHRYNNQDHSMLTAMLAIENIAGAQHDLWSVNVDESYHEDVESAPQLTRRDR